MSTLVGAAVIAGAILLVRPANDYGSIVAPLGSLLFAFAGVYTVDKNKGTLTEDIWWNLQDDPVKQLAVIYLAWLPVALLQGASVFAMLAIMSPSVSVGHITLFVIGAVGGIPVGLLLTAMARHLPGFSVASGILFLAGLFAINALPMASPVTKAPSALPAAYAVIGLLLYMAVARLSRRKR
ncbi:MAG: hypothetical protein ACK5SX_04510 [Sandaracinobacter sp.]